MEVKNTPIIDRVMSKIKENEIKSFCLIVIDKFVSYSPYGFNVFKLFRIIIDFKSDVANMHIYGSVFSIFFE